MFTGIINYFGTITAVSPLGDGRRVVIRADKTVTEAPLGASIACSGVCLTVAERDEETFTADVSAETLRCSTAGSWQVGTMLNLERAMQAGHEFGGHMVTGHVDTVAVVAAIQHEKDSWRIDITYPSSFQPLIAAKGSVCLDGISLTVNGTDDAASTFWITIVPHTLAHTTLNLAKVGTHLNLEVDVIARYIQRQITMTTV